MIFPHRYRGNDCHNLSFIQWVSTCISVLDIEMWRNSLSLNKTLFKKILYLSCTIHNEINSKASVLSLKVIFKVFYILLSKWMHNIFIKKVIYWCICVLLLMYTWMSCFYTLFCFCCFYNIPDNMMLLGQRWGNVVNFVGPTLGAQRCPTF